MNKYTISTSFDMANRGAWVRSGEAESAEDFAKREFPNAPYGYEMFIHPCMDIVFVKYQRTGSSYMVFRIG